MTRRFGLVAAASIIGVLSLVPVSAGAATAGHTAPRLAAKCHVDHHVYAKSLSAKRVGTSVKVEAKLGRHLCGGLDDERYKYGTKTKTITVPKSAHITVLKDGGTRRVTVAVRKLPHYIKIAVAAAGADYFQLSGPRTHVKKFWQVFFS
jgi:hypothetical protein